MEFVTQLFDTSDFTRRWNCGNWSDSHGWLHILSDLGVWSAYIAIPCVLCFFFLRRKDLPFRKIFLLFGAFILACGTTHLMEALIFWWPAYRLAAVIKLFTALVSWATVVALVPIVPRVLAMRSPEELEREIEARIRAEKALQQVNEDLERRIEARTAELLHERERFRTTLASIGDAVIATDIHGNVTFLNGVAATLTAWPLERAQGQRLPLVFQIVHETTRQPVENPAERALQEGRVIALANHTLLVARDGTETPIDDSAAPIRDAQGTILGAVLVFRDVTQRRQAEAQVRASHERLRFVLDSMPQKIFTARANGEVDYYNPQWHEFTGLTFEQMRDWGWTTFIHPDDVTANVQVWKQSIATGAPFQFEHRFRRADGEYRWHITRARAVRASSGEIILWVGANTEIHDVKSAQEELRNADRKKDEFLATLAHELRNPLAPIRNGLQILRLAGNDVRAFDQVRELLERQVGQMVRLIDDLLDVSRITRGKLQLRTTKVELRSVLENAIETSRPLIDQHGHELIVTLPPQALILEADLTRLAQVFWNLLNNSAKYTEPGGRIWLTVEHQAGNVVVTVKDTGIGIPKESQQGLFEMFSQVEHHLERSQGGLGIGLALVRGLVQMHGGTIVVQSAGIGQGSEFIVRLPLVAGDAPVAVGPGVTVNTAPPAQRRILVVDDNRDSAASLGMMLSLLGNDIRTAHDGLEALEIAEAFRPEVILLDIGLPKLNGYEVCRRIRMKPWGGPVFILASTGWGQEEDRRRAQESGFDHHLVKPIDPAVLIKLLAEGKSLPVL